MAGFILAEAAEIEVYSNIHTHHPHGDGITSSGIWYALRMLSVKGGLAFQKKKGGNQ